MGPSQWLYRKLYTGRVPNGIDHLTLDLLPKVAALETVQRWFFIRFADSGGTHMRLRVCLPAAQHPLVDRLCEDALQRLPGTPPSFYRPTVGRLDESADHHSILRFVSDNYVPERAHFGINGMAFAEELFQRSSEIAVDVLHHEAQALYSRKSVILCLMTAIKDAFLPDASVDFWSRYSDYWLERCQVDGTAWRVTFERKANALKESGLDLAASASSVPEAAHPLVARWRESAARCAISYADCPQQEIPTFVLAINFAHLMNNRLGLVPLEDAYYARLLHAAQSAPFATHGSPSL